MKLAFFSDIHANLPALEAVLADIDSQAPDAVFCLGDLVGYNIWPNEVAGLIRLRNIPTLAGNYDYGIGRGSDECGCAYKSEEEKGWGDESIAFTNEIVHSSTRNYLRTLPKHMALEFELQESFPMRILLVHGSPRRINEYLHADRPDKSLLRLMNQAESDLLLFGHTHIPYHRILEDSLDGQQRFRHAINLGAVGKPKDGDPRACYVLLELNASSTLEHPGGIDVVHRRVEYDVEKAARAVEQSKLPNAYADMLRKAY